MLDKKEEKSDDYNLGDHRGRHSDKYDEMLRYSSKTDFKKCYEKHNIPSYFLLIAVGCSS